jgi:hypothetical protein
MSIPNGLAPGFYNIADILARRVQTVNAATISDALQLSAAIHQRVVDSMYSTSIQRVDWFKRRYRVGGNRRVQSMTQDGTPKPLRSGLEYDVALPLQIVADSIALNMWAENKQTVQDVNDEMVQILEAFNDWEKRTFQAAIFTDTAWTYADDSDDVGDLTIQVLANGSTDGQLYPLRDGSTSTVDHYLAQAASIADTANPYETAYSTLKQHPTNSGPYVSYIASDLVSDTKDLANFRDFASSFVAYGGNATVANQAAMSYLGWGNEVVGVVEGAGSGVGMIIVEADFLPSGYIITQAMGAGAFVGLREELIGGQSLIMRETRPDTNMHKMDFYRRAGKGVVNRIAACVTLIGSGSYSAPTGYTAPYVGVDS